MTEKPKIFDTEKAYEENTIVVKAKSRDVSTTLAASDLHRSSLQPPKSSFSLPNSANSSSPSTLVKKKVKHRSMESPCQANTLMNHQHDQLQEMHLRRSRSCGDERACAPSDEFDLWWAKPSAVKGNNIHNNSFSKTETIRGSSVRGKDMETYEDEGFKCSALCLYLPGFGKAKAVKSRKEGSEMEGGRVTSKTVSMEKFECGSWVSSALFHEIEGDPMNSNYFDLPMELIKCSANDVHAPVTSAFVFEKDLKGVPKNGSSRKSLHHVRLSASSATSKPASPASCIITPRLRKPREDFTLFLEAQSS